MRRTKTDCAHTHAIVATSGVASYAIGARDRIQVAGAAYIFVRTPLGCLRRWPSGERTRICAAPGAGVILSDPRESIQGRLAQGRATRCEKQPPAWRRRRKQLPVWRRRRLAAGAAHLLEGGVEVGVVAVAVARHVGAHLPAWISALNRGCVGFACDAAALYSQMRTGSGSSGVVEDLRTSVAFSS